MPNPSTVTADNINAELGVGGTTSIDLTNNWVRNVAAQTSGAISYAGCRWGINFWAGTLQNTTGSTTWTYPNYGANAFLFCTTADSVAKTGTATANSELTLFANGVLRVGVIRRGTASYQHRTWLTSGAAGDYTGQLNQNTVSGTGALGASINTDLALSTDRSWYVNTSAVGGLGEADIEDSAGLLIIKDAGGTLISRPYRLRGSATSASTCPTCCFTPDTLITMGDQSLRRIDRIRVGDIILVYDENLGKNVPTKVDNIIIRSERVMYEYVFSNGNRLKATEDHPLFVVGKGYSCMNPHPNYKDLGTAKIIAVGDRVLNERGIESKIVEIQPIHYPDEVYTFENSRFYANGVLVY